MLKITIFSRSFYNEFSFFSNYSNIDRNIKKISLSQIVRLYIYLAQQLFTCFIIISIKLFKSTNKQTIQKKKMKGKALFGILILVCILQNVQCQNNTVETNKIVDNQQDNSKQFKQVATIKADVQLQYNQNTKIDSNNITTDNKDDAVDIQTIKKGVSNDSNTQIYQNNSEIKSDNLQSENKNYEQQISKKKINESAVLISNDIKNNQQKDFTQVQKSKQNQDQQTHVQINNISQSQNKKVNVPQQTQIPLQGHDYQVKKEPLEVTKQASDQIFTKKQSTDNNSNAKIPNSDGKIEQQLSQTKLKFYNPSNKQFVTRIQLQESKYYQQISKICSVNQQTFKPSEQNQQLNFAINLTKYLNDTKQEKVIDLTFFQEKIFVATQTTILTIPIGAQQVIKTKIINKTERGNFIKLKGSVYFISQNNRIVNASSQFSVEQLFSDEFTQSKFLKAISIEDSKSDTQALFAVLEYGSLSIFKLSDKDHQYGKLYNVRVTEGKDIQFLQNTRQILLLEHGTLKRAKLEINDQGQIKLEFVNQMQLYHIESFAVHGNQVVAITADKRDKRVLKKKIGDDSPEYIFEQEIEKATRPQNIVGSGEFARIQYDNQHDIILKSGFVIKIQGFIFPEQFVVIEESSQNLKMIFVQGQFLKFNNFRVLPAFVKCQMSKNISSSSFMLKYKYFTQHSTYESKTLEIGLDVFVQNIQQIFIQQTNEGSQDSQMNNEEKTTVREQGQTFQQTELKKIPQAQIKLQKDKKDQKLQISQKNKHQIENDSRISNNSKIERQTSAQVQTFKESHQQDNKLTKQVSQKQRDEQVKTTTVKQVLQKQKQNIEINTEKGFFDLIIENFFLIAVLILIIVFIYAYLKQRNSNIRGQRSRWSERRSYQSNALEVI